MQSVATTRTHVHLGGQTRPKRTLMRAVTYNTTQGRAFEWLDAVEMHVFACSWQALHAPTCVCEANRGRNARRCVQSGLTPRTNVHMGGRQQRKCTRLRTVADNATHPRTFGRPIAAETHGDAYSRA